MNYEVLAKYAALAPIGTFLVALLAAIIALRSLATQKRIARGRAAIDFFVKAEMDIVLRDLYIKYENAIDNLQRTPLFEDFVRTENHNHIRTYLDIIELMAIGVNRNVFDERVCHGFWRSLLANACRDAKLVIAHTRQLPDSVQMYIQLLKLNQRWDGPDRFWQTWWRE